MAFIQIIEFSTSRIDEVRQLLDDFRASTEGRRTVSRGTACADRDQPNRYINIIEFPSYEEAMRNSEMPETSAFAEQLGKLCDGPATFRNLDVIDVMEG